MNSPYQIRIGTLMLANPTLSVAQAKMIVDNEIQAEIQANSYQPQVNLGSFGPTTAPMTFGTGFNGFTSPELARTTSPNNGCPP